ncbi:RraA family protein [Parapedobacter lycopersici]|uniref:RraA family protein n=1 Tax=Parapedobacter lycopersici TaxID=1864939 RepID=UPI00214D4786|nr:RraA family protein [Parapedobacter lycopersici]
MNNFILVFCFLLLSANAFGQRPSVGTSPEYVQSLTAQWRGERFPDGRPHVPDAMLKRLEHCTLEQIWGYLGGRGYHHQVAKDWQMLNPGETMVGRVVTARFMPARPDLDSLVKVAGQKEGLSQSGGNNIWPIDILTKGDVYVADGFGKVKDGTLIGSSLGNAIYGKTGKGVVFDGSIRDMQELKETAGFNAWIKGHDPSYIRDMTPISINAPIRVEGVTVFPGDVVFANDYGVVFIPAHLVGGLVASSEMTALRDEFERYLLRQSKYPSGEIHGKWSEQIKGEFRAWFDQYPEELTVTKEDIEKYLSRWED